jgi:hypothetical protein
MVHCIAEINTDFIVLHCLLTQNDMSKQESPSNYCDETCANEEMVVRGSKHVHVEKSLIMHRFLNKKPLIREIWKTMKYGSSQGMDT